MKELLAVLLALPKKLAGASPPSSPTEPTGARARIGRATRRCASQSSNGATTDDDVELRVAAMIRIAKT